MITDRVTTVLPQPDLMGAVDSPEALCPPVRAQHRFKLRKFWLKLHLYLGLFGGGVFVLMSLTGSFLVFYKAIDEWLNPALMVTSGKGTYRPLNEIVTAAKAAGPVGGVLDSVEWPPHQYGVFLTWHKVQTDRADEFRWIQVTINPYTAAVLTKDREWGGYLISLIYGQADNH